MPSSRSVSRVAAGAVAAAVVGGLVYVRFRSADVPDPTAGTAAEPDPPDLRETFPTPFHNVRPGVRYVGDAACASCHPDIAETFHAHPMGQSAELVGRVVPIERYDVAAKNPFTAMGFEFRVEKAGDRVTHRMSALTAGGNSLPGYSVGVDVAIGSGTRGRTYLSIRDGAVWQSPVSWFTKDARWDLSPSHELLTGGRRAITPGCLFCHTERVDPVPGAENRFREPLFPVQVSIGCERCHGPGELHVADRTAGRSPAGVDYSIVNPKHLPADLQTDVCRQCHLQGAERVVRRGRDLRDYRPGLPWDQFVTTFVRHPEESDYRKSVGQFEQMETSRCFTGSGGRLGCTSCHDPHAKPAPEAADGFYRDRCLSCHESRGCSAPMPERQARHDSCVACHMPKADSSNIAHAAITDHRVRRRPGADDRTPARQTAGAPFVPYRPGPHAPEEAERDRDWAIAVGRVVGGNPAARSLGRPVVERLTAALARWPRDAEAWEVLASVRGAAGDGPGAVEAARSAVAAAPESESALSRLALEATQAGDLDAALRAADRLVELNPTAVNHRLTRANVYIRRRDWANAEADAKAVLAIQPLYWKARLFQAVCRHHRGDPAGAKAEAAVAAGLIPSESVRAAYLRWFREQTW
ncbi:MAG TPA: tetratricopeptide repeat protein [Fimbriiglobus sp.]|nr:tetratricopeptide repeat protein [Fimbriiglobus sp.]